MTYFCYIDESGTPELPGTSTHFVLVGLALPIAAWGTADRAITGLLAKYGLENAEIHTAWLLRRFVEQTRIADFDKLDWAARRASAERYRAGELLRLRGNPKAHRQAKKNYQHTQDYVHLTETERRNVVTELAQIVSEWESVVLFAEAINKLHLDEAKTGRSVSEQAFEQVVTRFDTFLLKDCSQECLGVLVHDNNQTVADKHTEMMRDFHNNGTLWSKISRIAETPLFVDSKLTRMVQIADLCSYAIRRYVENGEEALFDAIFKKAHAFNGRTVGVRHFTDMKCSCTICAKHRKIGLNRPPRRAAQHSRSRGGPRSAASGGRTAR